MIFEIKTYFGEDADLKTRQILCRLGVFPLVKGSKWMERKGDWKGKIRYCSILYKDEVPVAFALLHKRAAGLLNRPHTLDYIYNIYKNEYDYEGLMKFYLNTRLKCGFINPT